MSVDEHCGGSQDWTTPNALTLDLWIKTERRESVRWWQSQIDCVAERISRKTKTQIDWLLANSSLDWMFASFNCPPEFLGPGPQCRLQSTLTRERSYHSSLCGFCEQPQRPV